jgi:hypothetical protein
MSILFKNISMRFAILLVFVFVYFGFCFGQSSVVVRDFQTWSSVGLDAKLGERFSFGIEEQLRLKKNSTVLDSYLSEASLKFAIIPKQLFLGAGYRYIDDRNKELVSDKEHRYNFDLIYKQSLESFRLTARFRYQNHNDIGETIEMGDYPRHTYRIKLQSEYKIKNWKLDPVLSVELFRQYEKYTLPNFDNIRFRLGTDYKLKKFGDIGFFYQLDRSLSLSYPQTFYVFGISYKYDFGNLLK